MLSAARQMPLRLLEEISGALSAAETICVRGDPHGRAGLATRRRTTGPDRTGRDEESHPRADRLCEHDAGDQQEHPDDDGDRVRPQPGRLLEGAVKAAGAIGIGSAHLPLAVLERIPLILAEHATLRPQLVAQTLLPALALAPAMANPNPTATPLSLSAYPQGDPCWLTRRLHGRPLALVGSRCCRRAQQWAIGWPFPPTGRSAKRT